MDSKLLTTQEVADYFGVNSSVVTQKFCKEGLKYIRLSQTDFRYNKKDIIDFEEKLKVSISLDDYLDNNIPFKTNKKCTLKV